MNCNTHLLQAYLDEELQNPQIEKLESHLQDCPSCQEELRLLEDGDQWLYQELDRLYPAPVDIPDVYVSLQKFEQAHISKPKRKSWFWPLMSWSSAMACILVVMLTDGQSPMHTISQQVPVKRTHSPQQNSKHKPVVRKRNKIQKVRPRERFIPKAFPVQMYHAYRIENMGLLGHTQAQPTRDQQVLRPSDWIQFRYRSRSSLHLMVVGLNQKHELFAYLPLQGTHSLQLSAGEGRLPEKALELDDILGQEVFFLITSSKPFSFTAVKEQVLKRLQTSQGNLENLRNFTHSSWDIKTILIQKKRNAKLPFPTTRPKKHD